jgi:hypothetical protein
MKDEYQWFNSVQFNQRNKVTENWPAERAKVEQNPKLKPFLGMTVGGKKDVATPIPPPQEDSTGTSNLKQLVTSNYGLDHPIAKSGLNGTSPGAKGADCDCHENKSLVTLKGELIACCPNSGPGTN